MSTKEENTINEALSGVGGNGVIIHKQTDTNDKTASERLRATAEVFTSSSKAHIGTLCVHVFFDQLIQELSFVCQFDSTQMSDGMARSALKTLVFETERHYSGKGKKSRNKLDLRL